MQLDRSQYQLATSHGSLVTIDSRQQQQQQQQQREPSLAPGEEMLAMCNLAVQQQPHRNVFLSSQGSLLEKDIRKPNQFLFLQDTPYVDEVFAKYNNNNNSNTTIDSIRNNSKNFTSLEPSPTQRGVVALTYGTNSVALLNINNTNHASVFPRYEHQRKVGRRTDTVYHAEQQWQPQAEPPFRIAYISNYFLLMFVLILLLCLCLRALFSGRRRGDDHCDGYLHERRR